MASDGMSVSEWDDKMWSLINSSSSSCHLLSKCVKSTVCPLSAAQRRLYPSLLLLSELKTKIQFSSETKEKKRKVRRLCVCVMVGPNVLSSGYYALYVLEHKWKDDAIVSHSLRSNLRILCVCVCVESYVCLLCPFAETRERRDEPIFSFRLLVFIFLHVA